MRQMEWQLSSLDGERVAGGKASVLVPARASTLVKTVNVKTHLDSHGPRRLLMTCALRVRGKVVSSNLVLFARPKHLELEPPKCRTAVHKAQEGSFTVTLSASRPALWAWIELARTDAMLSNNFVHVMPGQPVEMLVTPAQPMTLAAFKRQLRVRSLIDTYA